MSEPTSAEGLTRYRHRLVRGDWRVEDPDHDS